MQSPRPPDSTATAAVTDFQVLDTGPRIGETYDCVRTVVAPWLFADEFESGNLSGWSAAAP